jgi:hypothetical protein
MAGCCECGDEPAEVWYLVSDVVLMLCDSGCTAIVNCNCRLIENHQYIRDNAVQLATAPVLLGPPRGRGGGGGGGGQADTKMRDIPWEDKLSRVEREGRTDLKPQ